MKTIKLYSLIFGLILSGMSGLAIATSSIGTVFEDTGGLAAKDYMDFSGNDSISDFNSPSPGLFGVGGWTLVEKNDSNDNSGILSNTGIDDKSGKWSIDDNIWGTGSGEYTSLVVVLKAGNKFVAWLLNDGVTSGDWTTSRHDLSHISLYGTTQELPDGGGSPSSVPLPAAVWLFGSSMLGLIGFSRRKV